jgi:hypothetical protein
VSTFQQCSIFTSVWISSSSSSSSSTTPQQVGLEYLAGCGHVVQQGAGLRVQRHRLGARQPEGGGVKARHIVRKRRQPQHVGCRCTSVITSECVLLLSDLPRACG